MKGSLEGWRQIWLVVAVEWSEFVIFFFFIVVFIIVEVMVCFLG